MPHRQPDPDTSEGALSGAGPSVFSEVYESGATQAPLAVLHHYTKTDPGRL
jgi:homoserine kinase